MSKIKVLLHSLWYPISIASYFRLAIERRDDIDLRTVGITTGNWIPWKGGVTVPQKYAYMPDIPLPQHFSSPIADYNFVKHQLGDWKPDLVLTIDASSRWNAKPEGVLSAAIGTDSHCLSYDASRAYSDKFWNMHQHYAHSSDLILPYCYDPSVHYRVDGVEKEYDVAMIGVEYQHRIELAERLKAEGISVLFSNGEIFDEYREIHQKAKIGLNWSSLADLNARAFEVPAMGNILIANRVPDMDLPRHHYFDFAYTFPCDNEASHGNKSRAIPGAIEKVKYVLANLDQAYAQLEDMRSLIAGETYDARVQTVLEECGLV